MIDFFTPIRPSYSALTVAHIRSIQFDGAGSDANLRARIRELAAIYGLGEIEVAILLQADPTCVDHVGRIRA